MCKLGRHVFLAAVLLHAVALADATGQRLPMSALPAVSTCKSGEINYITHTLPQQCLWSRPPPSSSAAAASNEIVSPEHSPSTSATAFAAGDGAAQAGAREAIPIPDAGVMPSNSSVRLVAEAMQHDSQPRSAEPLPNSEAEVETDSPLDNAHFLSFEEWKTQNLAKVGQSPENVGHGRAAAGSQGRKPRPVNINSELDFLGEDTEIELDFGFGSKKPPPNRADAVPASGQEAKDATEDAGAAGAGEMSHRPRGKDAGKTCKERFNYASFDCAATVLKTNAQCKSSSSVLVENKDSYMLNECAVENKFVIVELCEDILVDTVVLANFEFFSSMFRTFRLSVSDRYPVKLERWKDLGTFEARNSRDIQAFLVENPLIWARYLRIEFLSHYGNEFYCPVSLLRVHGTTMMEEFRHQEEAARGEEYLDEVVESDIRVVPVVDKVPDDRVAAGSSKEAGLAVLSDDATPGGAENSTVQVELAIQDTGDCLTADHRSTTSNDRTTSIGAGVPDGGTNQSNSRPVSTITSRERPDLTDQLPSKISQSPHHQSDILIANHSTSAPSSPNDAGADMGYSASSSPAAPADDSRESASPLTDAPVNGTSTTPVTGGEGTKTSATQPPSATPTMQESFFKSIHKRLQMLESNSTLSLQYIEDQSRILRDAFGKVEKRQLGKTEKFLNQLNGTLMAELRELRQQYDQLWQSTIIELETHREQHQQEMLAISTRLTLLADELVFQKRMAAVQSTLVLLCLGLVLFARAGSGYLELPRVQQMMQKSQTALRLQFDSPASSSSSPPASYRRHARTSSSSTEAREPGRFPASSAGSSVSDASTDGPRSPALAFSPPTPTSTKQSPEPLRKTCSSPSTPRGFRDADKLDWLRASRTVVLEEVGESSDDDGRNASRRRQNSHQRGDSDQPGDPGGSDSESDDRLGYI